MHGEPAAERDAEAAADRQGAPGPDSRSVSVQQAVEQFVEQHSCGAAPDPATFAARYPVDVRPQILAQCREFLAFDGLLGHQEWQPLPQAESHGRTFGDFTIHEELGRGGMGIVYLATQRSLHRRVALKVMASGLTLSKRHVERFRREAAAAANLRHPAIVAVHSLFEVDGTFALAMDFVAGRNLADILDDLRLGNGDQPGAIEGSLGIAAAKGHVAECAMLGAQLASALAAAHEAGVVHRDLKPRNLMIDDRRQVRLLDFGLAKSLGDGSISLSGEITGTAYYMSPEQTLAKRVAVDHRTDVFAAGVILYELLTLRRPFDGKNLQQIVYEICFKEPVPLQRRNPKVPRDLVTIVQKAIEKDPQNRYQSAAELEADLQRFLRWEPIHARPAGAVSRLGKWLRRHRTGSAIAAAALLVLTAVLGIVWYRAHADAQQADQLLAAAEQRAAAGELDRAIALVNDALQRRNDEPTRTRLALYYEKSERAATQEKTDVAEAALLVQRSNQALAGNRRLGVLLALAADRLRSSAETRSAVLAALGSGCRTTTLAGHRGRVLAARWSPDGQHIATTGSDGQVQLWDAATGTQVRVLTDHEPNTWVTDPRFLQAGERIATAGADGTVRVWRCRDGALLQTWRVAGVVSSLSVDARGARALVTSYGKSGPHEARVWDTASGEPLGPAVVHPQHVVAAALSPDGNLAATWGGDAGVVRLWRAATGEVVAELAGHGDRVRGITFAANGERVATACLDGAVRVYAVADGRLLATMQHSRAVGTVVFGADGDRLVSGSDDRTARQWRLVGDGRGGFTAREECTFLGAGDAVLAVGYDPSGQLAVVAGRDGVVRLYDASGGSEVLRYEVGGAISGASFDPDGRRVLATTQQGAIVWDLGDARGVVTLRQPGSVPATCFDRSGEHVATAGDDERLRLWNARDARLAWESPPLGNPVQALDVDEAGERIAASTVDGVVAVHRLGDGAPLYVLRAHRGRVPVVRFAAGGSRLLSAGAGAGRDGTAGDDLPHGLAVLWNTNDQSQALALPLPAAIVAADLSGDGSVLATVENKATSVRLWRAADGTPRGTLAHGAPITVVRFAPDGRSLLSCGRDGRALLQDLDGHVVATFAAGQALQGATFAPDGRRVLTCGAAGSAEAQLWDVASASELLTFRGHRGTVTCGALSRDGAWVATAASDGTTCIWPTDPVAVAARLPLAPLGDAERNRYGVRHAAQAK